MLHYVRAHYPNAISSNDFITHTYKVPCEEYCIKPHNILLANSICSDDANAIEYPEAGRQMLGPFNLGGLNGYPFGGLTGMGAFSGHVPDDGAAMVFYAPHIGIGREQVPKDMAGRPARAQWLLRRA